MKHQSMSRRSLLALSAFAVSAGFVGSGLHRTAPTMLLAADGAPTKLEIKTLSTDPDRATGGNLLVQIAIPAGTPAESVRVTLDGRDVGSVFQSVSPNTRVGLVAGVARDHELPDYRSGDVRTVAATLHLPDGSVRAA